MPKILTILLRILSLPFVYGLHFIYANYVAIKHTVNFLRYGGEWIVYIRGDKERLSDIFTMLKKMNDEK